MENPKLGDEMTFSKDFFWCPRRTFSLRESTKSLRPPTTTETSRRQHWRVSRDAAAREASNCIRGHACMTSALGVEGSSPNAENGTYEACSILIKNVVRKLVFN